MTALLSRMELQSTEMGAVRAANLWGAFLQESAVSHAIIVVSAVLLSVSRAEAFRC